eukprot:4406027-Alexandrium_andersonii.AAC.1
MPLVAPPEGQLEATMVKGESDLKWILSDNGVPDDAQAAIFHVGRAKFHVFSGIGETRAEAKAALKEDIGLD